MNSRFGRILVVRGAGAAGVLALALLVAPPARAGVVYVALAADVELKGVRYLTELKASNPTDTPRSFTAFFIKTNDLGINRPEGAAAPSPVTIPPGETRLYRSLAPAGSTGVLELNADNALVFSARLVPRLGEEEKDGGSVPVVSSGNLVPGGRATFVKGLWRNADRTTAIGILNLSKAENECRAELIGPGGQGLINPTIIRLPGLTQWFFPDILNFVGVEAQAEARLQLTCQGAAFAFGFVLNSKTGEVISLFPATTGDSTLTTPGAEPACPEGAVCFAEQGVFHVPSRGNDIWEKSYAIEPGRIFKRLKLQITFQHGGWDRQNSDYIHNVFWVYRNEWRSNTFGYVNLRGPNRHEITNTTNVNQAAGVIKKTTADVTLTPGQTYKVDYTYDTTAGRIETIITTLDGTVLARMTDSASAQRIETQGAGFTIWCGLERIHFEVPTHGWTYSDLSFQLLP